MNQFLAAMHRLLQAISQLAQVAAAYGESRGRSWSSQVQMHHMLESLQIQASFKGKQNYNLILCFTMYLNSSLSPNWQGIFQIVK